MEAQSFLGQISRMNVHEVRKRLARSDILVTNQGDKVVQLAKLVQLNRKVSRIEDELSRLPKRHPGRARWSELARQASGIALVRRRARAGLLRLIRSRFRSASSSKRLSANAPIPIHV